MRIYEYDSLIEQCLHRQAIRIMLHHSQHLLFPLNITAFAGCRIPITLKECTTIILWNEPGLQQLTRPHTRSRSITVDMDDSGPPAAPTTEDAGIETSSHAEDLGEASLPSSRWNSSRSAIDHQGRTKKRNIKMGDKERRRARDDKFGVGAGERFGDVVCLSDRQRFGLLASNLAPFSRWTRIPNLRPTAMSLIRSRTSMK